MATDASSRAAGAASAAVLTGRQSLPRKFGRYALFDFIGKGGMAEIYLARAKTELAGARLCVVKQILPELASHSQFAELLIHEAKLAARLSHANIVQVFDLGRADERLYIAMDYVEGFDLNDLLRRCSRAKLPLPFEFALRIVSETLRGLDYAHRRVDDAGKPLGIVHRDVSPSNILLSFEGEVKLCDFGIAHANEVAFGPEGAPEDSQERLPDGATAVDEAIKGKAGYMSPEHARGESIDARADVFAAGIVLWELIAGRRMYRADTGKLPLIDQARAAEIPKLPMRGLPLEVQLHAIAHKALAVKREDRYASAHLMLRDVESYMAGSRLVGSPIRFGEWLVEKFAADIVQQRRARERAVEALERGAPVSLVPLPPAPTPLPSVAPPALTPSDTSTGGSSVPNISATPLPTPAPTPVPGALLRPVAPAEPPPMSGSPRSIAAVDVSPPSSQLAATPQPQPQPQPQPRSTLKYVLLVAGLGVIALVVAVVLYLRLRA